MRTPNKLVLFVCIACLVGCASGLKVHKFPDTSIDPDIKTFVFLTKTQWDNELRIELLKQGFKVKKFSSTSMVRASRITKSDKAILENEKSYSAADAKYGISLTQGRILDWCPFNDQIKANFDLEVTDLSTNEVVLIIQKGNWTGSCGPFSLRSKYVFQELTEQLKVNWR